MMSSNRFKVKKQDVWWLAQRAFPDYKGRKFNVSVGSTITFYDTNWGGGTRNEYVAVVLSKEDTRASRYDAPAPWMNPIEGATVEIPKGFAVVEHTIFQGHDLGLTIHVRPDDVQPLLPSKLEDVRQAAFLGTVGGSR